jgi:hypothetical protein
MSKKIFIIWDGGYSDKSVEGAFSTREKAKAFLKRFFAETANADRDIEEFSVDAFDDADWPPGYSMQLTVRPAPPKRTAHGPFNYYFSRYQAITGDRVVRRPEECTREWTTWERGDRVPAWQAYFWGTEADAKAFAEAKLAEERAKLPPEIWPPQSYVGRDPT